jgi:hypothetical protein
MGHGAHGSRSGSRHSPVPDLAKPGVQRTTLRRRAPKTPPVLLQPPRGNRSGPAPRTRPGTAKGGDAHPAHRRGVAPRRCAQSQGPRRTEACPGYFRHPRPIPAATFITPLSDSRGASRAVPWRELLDDIQDALIVAIEVVRGTTRSLSARASARVYLEELERDPAKYLPDTSHEDLPGEVVKMMRPSLTGPMIVSSATVRIGAKVESVPRSRPRRARRTIGP